MRYSSNNYAMLLIYISKVVQNVNLIVALLSALCDCPLENSINIVQYSSHEKRICALLLIISNVVQIVLIIIALPQHSVAVYLQL